jgi:hypothetical protein
MKFNDTPGINDRMSRIREDEKENLPAMKIVGVPA